jgi:tRNA(fMet)-specific endonuclease VapC
VNKALLDTNILSYFLRGQAKVVSKLDEYGQFYDFLTFSILTYYEIKAGLTYRDSTRVLTQFKEIARESEILLLSLATMDIASNIYTDLRRRGLLIAPMDLLIAASAIEHGYTLITANVRHFQNIQGLRYENWAQ